VFTRSGTTWTQQAYLKASNANIGWGASFGHAVGLSANGNTLAVGAPYEQSSATGVNGNQNDTSVSEAGATYVFTRSGTTWSQQAYVKATNTGQGDLFGSRLAVSGDGNTLAVTAWAEDSAATGINGSQTSNAAPNAGAIYVYTRSGSTWSSQAYVKASNTAQDDNYGTGVALSYDGSTLAAGAWHEDSNAVDVNGNQADNSKLNRGAAYVYSRSGSTWSQQAYVKPHKVAPGDDDGFGMFVALSTDGNILAVGAHGEGSPATGINGDMTGFNAGGAGAVFRYNRNGTTWRWDRYVKASNTEYLDNFGAAVGMSGDAGRLAIASANEDSSATGVNGSQASNAAADSGAVYVID
jgi:hypothetical protein